MGKTYDQTNKGAIFFNHHKEKASHADFGGHINIDGVEHYMDGYLEYEHGASESSFMRLTFRKKGTRGGNIGKGELNRQDKDTDRHPDWKGWIETTDGNRLDAAGWKRSFSDKKTGETKYLLSLSLSDPQEYARQQQAEEDKPEREPGDDEDEEAPF